MVELEVLGAEEVALPPQKVRRKKNSDAVDGDDNDASSHSSVSSEQTQGSDVESLESSAESEMDNSMDAPAVLEIAHEGDESEAIEEDEQIEEATGSNVVACCGCCIKLLLYIGRLLYSRQRDRCQNANPPCLAHSGTSGNGRCLPKKQNTSDPFHGFRFPFSYSDVSSFAVLEPVAVLPGDMAGTQGRKTTVV